jgi:predicted DNA-binding transcriptional regulator AlpA
MYRTDQNGPQASRAPAPLVAYSPKAAGATAATNHNGRPNMEHAIIPPVPYVTISEFCERFGIGRTFYFKMRAAGDGPDELRLSRRKIVITEEALKAWERKRTNRPTG